VLVDSGARHVVITRGARGLLWARRGAQGSQQGDRPRSAVVVFEELPAIDVGSAGVVSTRGAGDCLVAGACWALSRRRSGTADVDGVRAALCAGLRAAHASVIDEAAVPEGLRPETLLAGGS
jgi:sugar/nucleoside kinase (ribokinase family)